MSNPIDTSGHNGPFHVPQHFTMAKPAAQMLAASAISQSLMYCLQRGYLEQQLSEYPNPKHLKLITSVANFTPPYLMRLDGSVETCARNPAAFLDNLRIILQSCHFPDKCQLVFLITSDGDKNRIYLGVRSLYGEDQDVKDLINHSIGSVVESLLPGITVSMGAEESTDNFISRNCRHGIALTGIPSKRTDLTLLGVDNMFSGLKGTEFAYIVLADPIHSSKVDSIIFDCHELMGKAKSLSSIKINLSKEYSQEVGVTVTEEESVEWTVSNEIEKKNILISLGIALIAAQFPPAAMTLPLVKEFINKSNDGLSLDGLSFLTPTETHAKTYGHTLSNSESFSSSSSEAHNFGQTQNYINSHMEGLARYLEQHRQRFERSRAIDCWNVGVYLMTPDPNRTLQTGKQLCAILNNEKDVLEPVRYHSLSWCWKKGAENSLRLLEEPYIQLVNPGTGELLDHPLGSTFSRLTTPLNTRELSLLTRIRTL